MPNKASHLINSDYNDGVEGNKAFDKPNKQMKTSKFTLPKRSKTLCDKIVQQDPWRHGVELALAIEENFDLIPTTITVHELAELSFIEEFAETHCLNSYYVASVLSRLLPFAK